MKVLLISSTNNVRNGYGNFTHEYCLALMRKGIPFTLLLPKTEPRYEYTTYPVEYILPAYLFTIKSKKIFEYLTFSYTTDADIVHSLFEFPYALIGAKIARRNKKPLIIGAQGTYAIKPLFIPFDRQALLWAYKQARIIVTSSHFTKDALTRYGSVTTPIDVIHNGVNVSRFDHQVEVGSIISQYPGKKIILTTGVLKPRKGHDVVIQALGLLKKKRDDFHYIIVGPDDEVGRDIYKENLKKSITELGLKDVVTFTGSVSDDELVKYFHACTLFVHTPRMVNWNYEGFGIVYLEAGACRKPIVASDSGGVRDAVVDGVTGSVVKEGDIEGTASAIEKLLDDPTLAERMGTAGYTYAQEHDWSVITDAFINLYKRLR